MSHVPDENLPEYREVRKARDSVDHLENLYFSRQQNPPSDVTRAKNLLTKYLRSLRVDGDDGR